jgi:hypothetical protein
MRRNSFLLVTISVPLFMGAGEPIPWKEYSPPDKSFTILLPGTPTEDKDVSARANSRAVTAKTGPEDGLCFIVVCQEIPKPVRRTGEAKRFLKGVERAFGEKSSTKSVKEIPLGTIPGKEFVAEGYLGKKVRCRAYVVGSRSYQLMALSDDSASLDSNEAARFFESFRLLNLPSNVLEEGGEDGSLALRLGQITGAGCVAAVVATIVVGVGLLMRNRRKKRHQETDSNELEQVAGVGELPPDSSSSAPRKRYGWPRVFGIIGAALGLLNGLGNFTRLGEEDPDLLFGYLVGSVAIAGLAGILIGVLVGFFSESLSLWSKRRRTRVKG